MQTATIVIIICFVGLIGGVMAIIYAMASNRWKL